MRRAHPLIYVALWVVVTLLAAGGFAAFSIGGRSAPAPLEAALGRETGALAGLGFNAAPGRAVAAVIADTTDEESKTEEADTAPLDTVPTHGWLSEMQVRAVVSRYFKAEDVNRAIRVAWCESRFNPTSTNPLTGATGLFHHLPEFWPQRSAAAGFAGAEPTDVEANVAAAAYAIYHEGGWAVFSCLP